MKERDTYLEAVILRVRPGSSIEQATRAAVIESARRRTTVRFLFNGKEHTIRYQTLLDAVTVVDAAVNVGVST